MRNELQSDASSPKALRLSLAQASSLKMNREPAMFNRIKGETVSLKPFNVFSQSCTDESYRSSHFGSFSLTSCFMDWSVTGRDLVLISSLPVPETDL